jgi:hypothetical protein
VKRVPVPGHERFTPRLASHNYRTIKDWRLALRREKAQRRARKRQRGRA